MEKTITELMNDEWRERAMYVLEERAIPQFADGLKPVQRFLMVQGLKSAKTKFEKVAAIGGNIASLGYHHGEASAQGALTAMGAEHSNNLQLFIGDGNFGSRLDGAAAAPRYIFAKVNSIVDKLYLDDDLTERHADPDIKTPKYFLPIIPMMLVNGVKGIATGFACDIPPHCPISIIDSLLAKCHGKTKEIKPKYYQSECTVVRSGNQYVITGKFEKQSQTKIIITEIPPIYESATYEAILEKLEDAGRIAGYENLSVDDKFKFVVTLKRNCKWTDEQIIKTLKLRSTHTWNVTSISPEGHLQEWNSDSAFVDIINEFYAFRLGYVNKRIAKKIACIELDIPALNSSIKFAKDVANKKFDFHISDDEFADILKNKYKMTSDNVTKTMNLPVRSFTQKNIEKMEQQLLDAHELLKYYKATTAEKEYEKDLQTLRKALK